MTGFARALTEALAAQLATVAGIAKVYPEWPEANAQLVVPSISIVTSSPQYERCSPYIITQGTVQPNNKATDSYCVGTWDVNLQLDLWAKYKIQRADLLDAVMSFLQPTTGAGFNLQLAAYFNEWASFCVTGQQWMDTDDSVTRKEWRGIIKLQATCRAVNTVSEFIITQPPVLTFDTPDTIT